MALASKAGVSNSNTLEGHILKKKFFAGRILVEKSLCGPQITRKALKISQIYLKFTILSVFEMFAGRTNSSGGPRVWDPCSKVIKSDRKMIIHFHYTWQTLLSLARTYTFEEMKEKINKISEKKIVCIINCQECLQRDLIKVRPTSKVSRSKEMFGGSSILTSFSFSSNIPASTKCSVLWRGQNKMVRKLGRW